MTSSKNSQEQDNNSANAVESESDEEESEVLEESPCGRWIKRREKVTQRDVPGIDCAFLAMDTEEGVEVVWNEVQISEKKSSKNQLEQIKRVFENLTQLDHANIVKFHKYWIDERSDRPRVIFITEYMSSGSLKQFLKKTKKNNKTLKAWKRWCTQILYALSYLHSCDPPITHGNLTTDTIFIQHNGLVKIGSVAPEAIDSHVKTYREEAKNMHYSAPEYSGNGPVTCAVDIYSFGVCALEMAALEIPGNGETGNYVSEESIQKTLDSLEDPLQKDFIKQCLTPNPKDRLTTRDLLFHKVLFEVPSLKIMACHKFVQNANVLPEELTNEAYQSNDKSKSSAVIAMLSQREGHDPVNFTVEQAHTVELEKLLEDVRNGVYPMDAFFKKETVPAVSQPRPVSPTERPESEQKEPAKAPDVEDRHIFSIVSCTVKRVESALQMRLQLKMDDKMNRVLECDIATNDTPADLAQELVHYGFINANDHSKVSSVIDESIKQCRQGESVHDKHTPPHPQPVV